MPGRGSRIGPHSPPAPALPDSVGEQD